MSITDTLKTKLETVRGLPSPPLVAMRIIEAAKNPDISLAGVAGVVTSDPAISAKILRMANSAAYAVPGGCTTLRRALLTLGLDATLVVALSFSLVVSLRRDKTTGLDHEYYWRRSLLSATAASAVGKALGRKDCEALFLAGLLQDIGMLALDKCEPELYARADNLERDHRAITQYEIEQLGCSHLDVSQWLLARWQLPGQIVDAIACSHGSAIADDDDFKRCVALSGPLADVWLCSDWSRPFHQLVEMAASSLNLSESQLSIVLDELRDRIPETEAIFEKDLVNHATGLAVMEEARELLMERGIQGIVADLNSSTHTETIAPVTLLRLQHWTELKDVLQREFAEAGQAAEDVGVVIAGIAGLDHVRETHGAEAANRLLRETARAMLSNAGSRVIGQQSRNEIVLWLANCNREGAELAGRRILRDFQSVLDRFSGEHDVQASLALGIAAMDRTHRYDSAQELVAAAHSALENARFGSLATTDDPVPAHL